MTYRSVLEILEADGQLPDKPDDTEYAIKFVNPDWTTHGGFRWPFPGDWTPEVDDTEWNPVACVAGGVHVAFTVAGAQSGGARSSHCVVVAYRPGEAGRFDGDDKGKLKVRRALSLGAVDLWLALRRNGLRANLAGAYLAGADLGGAYLTGAYLAGAYLGGADLTGAKWNQYTVWPTGFTPPETP